MITAGRAKPWEFRWRIVIMLASLPVGAILFTMAGMSVGRWEAPQTELWQRTSAATLAAVGLMLRVWGTHALSAQRMLRLQAHGETLVESGPFGILRNPLYLGTMLVIIGWSVLYGWLAAHLFAVFHAIRFQRIVVYEESLIAAESGKGFDDYCRRVNRWWPRWSNIPQAGWPRCSLAAVLSNGPFVGMAIGLFIITGTATAWIFFPMMLLGMLISGAFLIVRRWLQEDYSPEGTK